MQFEELLLVGAALLLSLLQLCVCSNISECSKNFECGEHSHSYPFWGAGLPEYCGVNGFELSCRNSRTEIDINDDSYTFSYRVWNISEANQIMTIVKSDVSDLVLNYCPYEFLNDTAVGDYSPFEYVSGTLNYTLFYGCPFNVSYDSGGSYCSYVNGTSINLYLTADSVRSNQNTSECQGSILIPVRPSSVNLSTSEILVNGFDVKYDAIYHSDCVNCTNSGGTCRYNGYSRYGKYQSDHFHCIPPGNSTNSRNSTNTGNLTNSGNSTNSIQVGAGGNSTNTGRRNITLDRKRDPKVIIIVIVVVGVVAISVCAYWCWRRMAKQREKKSRNGHMVPFNKGSTDEESSMTGMLGDNSDLPRFSIEMLAIATNDFGFLNRLGQGGFGSVYKGILPGPDGRVIAVKRLSVTSGQGFQEFKNEVTVISKLQHRNLVRLLGYCFEGDEKMLVYEYMPNKSLDFFLFGPVERRILNWKVCFQIIEGIARGMLYLHRDSRLRVIHRDLKASNVLLDEQLNPKISDFGMARIFGGNELQANTVRVVGTYGYMSPEYAMQGKFSEKSDVFSFGVLLLEIVTGKKNTSYYDYEESLSLLGYTWKLWKEDRLEEIVHPGLSEPCFLTEILRCIQVGLLCVQEFSDDRPNMSSVISMLTSETATLPTPREPAFTQRNFLPNPDSSQSGGKTCSGNELTVSLSQGR